MTNNALEQDIWHGHDQNMSHWVRAFQQGHMHHAWLLTGRNGTGKASFAWRAAAHGLTHYDNVHLGHNHGQGGSSVFTFDKNHQGWPLLLKGNHPDCHYISFAPKDDKEARKKDDGKDYELARNIKIDQIRALQKKLTVRPSLSQWRFVIIDPVDALEPKAANSLLKSLEEPPDNTVFFLIAHNPGRLLPTIRSRCLALNFLPLGEGDMRQVIGHHHPDLSPDAIENLVNFGKGSPGNALQFAEYKMADMTNIMEKIIASGDRNGALRTQLASMVSGKANRAKYTIFLNYVPSFAAQKIRHLAIDHMPQYVDAWHEMLTLQEKAVRLNLDAQNTAMHIGGLLARLYAIKET